MEGGGYVAGLYWAGVNVVLSRFAAVLVGMHPGGTCGWSWTGLAP